MLIISNTKLGNSNTFSTKHEKYFFVDFSGIGPDKRNADFYWHHYK